MKGRVLIIAGSDSGGGAGIQADIKTVTMLDGFAATAITALTAQNTLGVFGILPIPPEFIRQQIEVVLDDIGADAVKTGMLHDEAVIETVKVVDCVIINDAEARQLADEPNIHKAAKKLIELGFSRATAYRALKEAEAEKLLTVNAKGLLEVEAQLELEEPRL